MAQDFESTGILVTNSETAIRTGNSLYECGLNFYISQ